jgi:hypothetical protein
VLAAEHAGFVHAEDKATKYAQALVLIITTAAVGAPHFQALWATTERSPGDLVFLYCYAVSAFAGLVAVVAVTASVIVEGTPGMPADAETVHAFKTGGRLDVLRQLIDRYATSIERMRKVNRQKFQCVKVTMWATYATVIGAFLALAGYVFR